MTATKIDLASGEQVQGALPVANGGTGATSLAAAGIATTSSPTLTTPTLTGATVTGYSETIDALGTVGSSKTIPAVSSGTVVTATLTASTTCTFTMPTVVSGVSQSFVLLLKQPSSTGNGGASFTGVKWPSAGAPTITAAAGKMDVLTFISDGTSWFGTYVQGFTY